jgi:hypothetical protein
MARSFFFVLFSISSTRPNVNPNGAKKTRPAPLTFPAGNATIKKNETEALAMTEPTKQEILNAAEELLSRYRLAFLELAK